jgi:hypothetical protein
MRLRRCEIRTLPAVWASKSSAGGAQLDGAIFHHDVSRPLVATVTHRVVLDHHAVSLLLRATSLFPCARTVVVVVGFLPRAPRAVWTIVTRIGARGRALVIVIV